MAPDTGLALVACAQPGEVVGDRSFGVVGGLAAGVLAKPADVEAHFLAGSGRVAALGKPGPHIGDEPSDRGSGGVTEGRGDRKVGACAITADLTGKLSATARTPH